MSPDLCRNGHDWASTAVQRWKRGKQFRCCIECERAATRNRRAVGPRADLRGPRDLVEQALARGALFEEAAARAGVSAAYVESVAARMDELAGVGGGESA